MILLPVMGAGVVVEAYALLGPRSEYAGLLVGLGGIAAGLALPDALGGLIAVLGVIDIALWFSGRGRDRARRLVGGKARAVIAAMTRAMREAAPQPG